AAPGLPPLPGALSAAQLTSIQDTIAAQRRRIEALQAQLSAFDEQLAVMEQMLGPLAEWSKNWAEMEQRLLNFGRRPASGEASPARTETVRLDKPARECPVDHRPARGCGSWTVLSDMCAYVV